MGLESWQAFILPQREINNKCREVDVRCLAMGFDRSSKLHHLMIRPTVSMTKNKTECLGLFNNSYTLNYTPYENMFLDTRE